MTSAVQESDVVLRDGSTIHLRPMRKDDVPALRHLLEEDRARQAGRVPERRLPFPFESDAGAHSDAFVLVGETAGRVEAVASYQRDRSARDRAEVLFAIAPPLQGRGVGTRMLELLARIAWLEDIRTFDAWIRRDNDAVLRMFLDSGYSSEQRLEDGYCRVALSLAHTQAYQERAAERSEVAATASMKSFFEPRTVAVVGAGRERGKIGSEVLHNILKAGFTGRVTAVHPSAKDIDGVPAVRRVTDVPGDLDLVVISVPADSVPGVVDDCIAKRAKAISSSRLVLPRRVRPAAPSKPTFSRKFAARAFAWSGPTAWACSIP